MSNLTTTNIGMMEVSFVIVLAVAVAVIITYLIIPSGAKGEKGDTGSNALQIYRKEVFSNLNLSEISAAGSIVNTAQNTPGVLTTTGGVSILTPFKIENGGNVAMIAITASLDPSTTSYATGSTWQFFLGTNGGFDILPSSGATTFFFPGNTSSPRTFYFVPGQNGFPNIVLNPGSTLTIKGVQLSGRLNDITLGFVYRNPPSSW
jgi:hypothetical protein